MKRMKRVCDEVVEYFWRCESFEAESFLPSTPHDFLPEDSKFKFKMRIETEKHTDIAETT
jgi:hypothetical protein